VAACMQSVSDQLGACRQTATNADSWTVGQQSTSDNSRRPTKRRRPVHVHWQHCALREPASWDAVALSVHHSQCYWR